MFAYCQNNPVIHKDDSGYWLDTAIGVASLSYNVAKFVKNPTRANAKGIGFDVICMLIPEVNAAGVKALSNIGVVKKLASKLKGMSKSRIIRNLTKGSPVIGKKLEYIFGNATGTKHNRDRSIAMERQLNGIGIFNNAKGRRLMMNHLTRAYKNSKNILKVQKNGRVVRESLLAGPNGLLKVESVWEGRRLITVQLYGGRR